MAILENVSWLSEAPILTSCLMHIGILMYRCSCILFYLFHRHQNGTTKLSPCSYAGQKNAIACLATMDSPYKALRAHTCRATPVSDTLIHTQHTMCKECVMGRLWVRLPPAASYFFGHFYFPFASLSVGFIWL